MKIKPAKWDYRGRRWTSEAETRRRRRKKGALLRRSVDLVSYLTKSRYTIENTFIGTIKRCWQNATLKCDSQKENADWKLAVAPIKQRKQESSSNDNNSRKKEARVTNARLGGYDRLFFCFFFGRGADRKQSFFLPFFSSFSLSSIFYSPYQAAFHGLSVANPSSKVENTHKSKTVAAAAALFGNFSCLLDGSLACPLYIPYLE